MRVKDILNKLKYIQRYIDTLDDIVGEAEEKNVASLPISAEDAESISGLLDEYVRMLQGLEVQAEKP